MFNYNLFIVDNQLPPTLYEVLNSIVNYGKDEQIKIPDLAKNGRSEVFNFNYPLSQKVSKEEFETLLLNKFLMRRINFETFTAFQINLNVKLNEILPYYNKMFDSLIDWNIFEDGEITEKISNEKRQNESDNELNNESNSNSNSETDNRNSDTPQNRIEEVKNGEYLTNYSFDKNNINSSNTSKTFGKANSKDDINYNELIKRSPSDKMNLYKEFQMNIQSVYTLIFKELDCLFYQLVD